MIQECKGTSSTDNEQELPILKSVERGKSAPIKPKLQLQNDQRPPYVENNVLSPIEGNLRN